MLLPVVRAEGEFRRSSLDLKLRFPEKGVPLVCLGGGKTKVIAWRVELLRALIAQRDEVDERGFRLREILKKWKRAFLYLSP